MKHGLKSLQTAFINPRSFKLVHDVNRSYFKPKLTLTLTYFSVLLIFTWLKTTFGMRANALSTELRGQVGTSGIWTGLVEFMNN